MFLLLKPFRRNTPRTTASVGGRRQASRPPGAGYTVDGNFCRGHGAQRSVFGPWRHSPPFPTLSAPWEAGLYILHPRAPLLLLRVGFWQRDGVGTRGLEGIAVGGLSLSPSLLGCPPLRSCFSNNFLDPSVPFRPPPSHLVGSGAHDSQPRELQPAWFFPISLSVPVSH